MRYALAMLLALAPLLARAQQASAEEQDVLGKIARCLIAGLPADWAQVEMRMDLEAPNANGGDVSYLFRRSLSGGQYEQFRPCDYELPARALADLRKIQPPERGAWKTARFVIYPDGKFEVNYDYPKK